MNINVRTDPAEICRTLALLSPEHGRLSIEEPHLGPKERTIMSSKPQNPQNPLIADGADQPEDRMTTAPEADEAVPDQEPRREDPHDIRNLILPPVAEGFKNRPSLQRIAHGRPAKFKYVRTHPGLPLTEGLSEVRRCISLGILENTDEVTNKSTFYGCSAAVTAAYEETGIVTRHTLYLAQYRSGVHIIWRIKTPSFGGGLHPSSDTQLKAAEHAVEHWTSITWDGSAYILNEPDREALGRYRDPVWNKILSWEHALRLAWPGNELITDINSELILEMLGKA